MRILSFGMEQRANPSPFYLYDEWGEGKSTGLDKDLAL